MNAKSLSGFPRFSRFYPQNVGRGYFATYLLEDGLSSHEQRDRQHWLNHLSEHRELLFFIDKHLSCPEFQIAFDQAVSNHGVFFGKFFEQLVGPEVLAMAKSDNLDQHQLADFMAAFWNRSISDSSLDGLHQQAVLRLRDLYVLKLLEDEQRFWQLRIWFQRASKDRTCVICGASFAPINLPPSVYFGSNGQTEICFDCPVVERPTKKELIDLVPAFIHACGFVPSAAASPISFHFMSRRMSEPIDQVLTSYARMGGIEHVKKKFGSWFEALAKTGALPEGTLVTARGIKCLANDGHVCHSLDERRIDNWLSANGIMHTKEPVYPPHPVLNAKGLRRGDWLVGDHYIEYFGLIGDETYDKKVEEKFLLCKALGLRIIAIYPRDMSILDQKLARLLNN